MYGAGRTAGIGTGPEILAAGAARIVADGEVALDQIDLFPIIVDEGLGRVDARLEAQEPCAAAGLLRLVERAGEALLLDARGIAGPSFPPGAHVEAVEFEVRLHWVHASSPWPVGD